jgi:hypothetical protein
MTLRSDTFTEIQPFQATVNAGGQATLQITHAINGLIWQVFQIGFALNQTALNSQVGAHMNGIPLTAAVLMQQVMFPGFPYLMESFFVGPPYVGLKAGDQITCSVINAVPGDVFTAGAYISEEQDMGKALRPYWYQGP